MVTIFNPAMQAQKSIIMHNWPYLGSAQSLRETFTERPFFEHRRAPDIRGKVVHAKVPELEPSDQEGPQTCKTKNCKHCEVLDTSGLEKYAAPLQDEAIKANPT